METSAKTRIGIIGAGISGLSAGYQLIKGGTNPVVFEREGYGGGRMSSEIIEGMAIDRGAYTIPEFHKNTLQMIRELGLERSLEETSGTSATFDREKRYEIKIGSPTDFLKYKLLSLKNKKEMIRLFLYAVSLGKSLNLNDPSEKTFTLEDESAAEYLLREYNEEILEYIAYPIFSEIFLGTPETNSKVAFLSTVRNLTAFKIFSLAQGLGMLPNHLAKHLDIKLNSPVLKVRQKEKEGPYVVHTGGNVPNEHTFDTLIFAIPLPAILEIFEDLPPIYRERFRKIEYAPSMVAALATDDPYPNTSFINNLLRKDFGVIGNLIFDHHKGNNHLLSGKGLVTAVLSENSSRNLFAASDDSIFQRVLNEIDALFPGFSRKVIFSRLYRWKHGAVQLRPGTLFLQASTRKALERDFHHLHFVGDGLYRSSIEVQLHTGFRTAKKILGK